MRFYVYVIFFVLICTSIVFAEESKESTEDGDWKDKAQTVFDKTVEGAKSVGKSVADSTKSGLTATKDYFGNNTVADVAEDIADGAKSVGEKIADGAKRAWKGIGDYFS